MFLFKRNGYYHLQYIDEQSGKIRRISTKAKSKTAALKFLSDFKQHKLNNKKQIQKFDISISEFRKEYITFLTLSKSNSYIKSVKLSFRMLVKFCGDINLSRINTRRMESFITETFSRSKHASALYYRTLKAAFSKAVEWKYLSENPLTKVKMTKIPTNIPLFLTVEEMHLIIMKAEKKSMKKIFLFAFHTGMRLSEILNLHWNDVNLKNSFIKVANSEAFTTKGKEERIIPLNEKVLELLIELKELNNDNFSYIFRDRNGCRYNADYISKQFKKSVRLAGVNDKIHFHSIRHSFASNLVQRGVSLYVIKELLGHKSISTTQIYSHLRKRDLHNAVKVLDEPLKCEK